MAAPWPAGQRKPPPEVEAGYRRVIEELAAAGGALPATHTGPAADLTVTGLVAAFKRHADLHSRRPDGTVSPEVDGYRPSPAGP